MAKKGGKRGKSAGKDDSRSEEDRLAQQEKASKALIEKLEAEQKNTRINDLKIQDQWRQAMRSQKMQELVLSSEILKAVHKRQVDRKNSILEALEKDLNESEEQHRNAVQSHFVNVDSLIQVQNDRITDLEKHFNRLIEDMQKDFKTEKDKLMNRHLEDKTDLLGIVSRLDAQFTDGDMESKHEFQSLKEDIRNKNLEEKHALRIQLEGTIEELWRQFQTAWTNYNNATEERKQQFESLKNKDFQSARTIEQQMKKLQKLQDTITFIKSKMSNTSKEFDEKTRTLKEEKEAIQKQFQYLKRRMNQYREVEHKKLVELAKLSGKVSTDLQEKVKHAEKIIQLEEMNRKLETSQELVDRANSRYLNGVKAESAPDLSETVQRAIKMEHFYEQYNKVLLDKMQLESQKKELLNESNSLRSLLKQYLDGISVNDTVLGQSNSLFIVNGDINVSLRLLRPADYTEGAPKTISVIEASHVVQQNRVHL